jgi:hypothetical protein
VRHPRRSCRTQEEVVEVVHSSMVGLCSGGRGSGGRGRGRLVRLRSNDGKTCNGLKF